MIATGSISVHGVDTKIPIKRLTESYRALLID